MRHDARASRPSNCLELGDQEVATMPNLGNVRRFGPGADRPVTRLWNGLSRQVLGTAYNRIKRSSGSDTRYKCRGL